MRVFCRRVVVNKPGCLQLRGPVLFAANHPNSFLDGLILTLLVKGELYSLARGDAFAAPWAHKLLHWIKLLPVYRTSEGVENLTHNYHTFDKCLEAFKQGKQVIIFSEGRCINEWHLRPLKKGTARLALAAWEQGIPLQVIPLGINYNPFRNFGKNVFLNFGDAIEPSTVLQQPSAGQRLISFNEALRTQLQHLVYEIDAKDITTLRKKLCVVQPLWKQVVLAPLALTGAVLHLPFYFPIKAATEYWFDNDHFDSVMVGLTVLSYPFYATTAAIIIGIVWCTWWGLATALLLPLSAWACVQLKPQV